MGETYKSRYYPSFPNKYKGNPNNIICRSSWERRFCKWCDLNENILQWGSEEFSIPYISPIDNRIHKYFPDFIVKLRESSGRIRTYVIEVKPKKQTRPPKPGKRKTKSFIYETMEYAKNQAKWKAAEEFCADRMIEFKIITEDELGIK
jgi:hypothetical protein|tara:strand:+ start:2543 stop:2986 length:444 start_codon:yes stop_codon:yes gene_type:complete